MVKGKRLLVGTLVFIVAGAIGFGVLRWFDVRRGHNSEASGTMSTGGYEADTSNGIRQPGVIGISTRKDEVVRSCIAKEGKRYFDSNGVATKLSKTYQEDAPLVEILFRKRGLDEKIKPLRLSSVYLSCGRAGANYDMNGNEAVRMEIWNEVQPFTYNAMLYGEEYSVHGFFPRQDDQPGLIKGVTANVKFRTPESLMAGEIYRVELLLIDEVWERKEVEQKGVAAEKLKLLQEEEKLLVRITRYPRAESRGKLVAMYSNGEKGREFYEHESPGVMELKGPNKLGGELAIYAPDANGPLPVWAYISSLDRRDVSLPDDAELLVEDKDLVACYLSFSKEDADGLGDWKGVLFYSSANSRMPLFGASINIGRRKVEDYGKVPLKILPGKYDMRGFLKGDTYVLLGTLDISKENGKVYSVKLPN